MRILEVFVTFGDIFGSELSKIDSKTLDHAFVDHFSTEIIIHNEFSNPTVYDLPMFGVCVCFKVCIFVTFGHFGPFRGQNDQNWLIDAKIFIFRLCFY